MKSLKKLSAVAALFFTASVLFAQNETAEDKSETKILSLTVEDAVQYALKNSKSLKSSAIDLEIKKRASDNAWNILLPSLSASATAARLNNIDSTLQSANGSIQLANAVLGTTTPVMEESEKAHWSVIGNVGAQWNFNLAMLDSIKIAKNQYESGKITWEQAQRDTEVNIRKMFYGLLVQQESLEIEKESLKNAEALWKQAEKQYNNGSIPRIKMLNTRVTYENKKPKVLNAESSLNQTKESFALLLGLPYGEKFTLEGSIEFAYVDVNANELFSKYVEQNNTIRNFKKQIETMALSIRAKNLSTFTPSLSVNWSYNPMLFAMSEWNDKNIGFGEEKDSGVLSFTVVYKNIFDMLPCSSNMQSIKDLKQARAKLQLQLEDLYQNTEIEIHKLCDQLEVAKENIEAMQRNVTLAQEAYESTLKSYYAGQTERLEILNSEEQLNQAKLGLLSEKNNYVSAVLDLETKLNITLK